MNSLLKAGLFTCMFASLLAMTESAIAADINFYTTITRQGGQVNPNGPITYDYVEEKGGVTIEAFGVVLRVGTEISCSGAGPNACPSGVVVPGRSPDAHTDVEQAGIDYALSQIQLGVLTGNTGISVSGNPNMKQLKWNATGASFTGGFIKVWSWGFPEP